MIGKGSYHGQLPNTQDLNNLNTKLENQKSKKTIVIVFLNMLFWIFSC